MKTILSFQLTMPCNSSCNGKWSGDDSRYYRFKTVSEKQGDELSEQTFTYSFGDGWVAAVRIEKIDSAEKKKRIKVSSGFCGYEWMIDSIIDHGKILNTVHRSASIGEVYPVVPVATPVALEKNKEEEDGDLPL